MARRQEPEAPREVLLVEDLAAELGYETTSAVHHLLDRERDRLPSFTIGRRRVVRHAAWAEFCRLCEREQNPNYRRDSGAQP